MAVVCTAIFLDALDLSITQIALPSIQADTGLSTPSLQWVVTAYVLTYGGLLLFGGRAADLLGRRRIFLTGLVLFGAASLACGLSPSGGILIGARAVQGIGAALTVPAAVAIIAAAFPEGDERNRALGFFSAAASSGFVFGLVLGGVLTDLLSWEWIFLVKVPIVAAVVLVGLTSVPRDGPAAGARSFDLAGAATSTGGLLLLVLGVTRAAEPGASISVTALTLVAAAALLATFVVVESRTPEPLLPFGIFRSRILRYADVASLSVLFPVFGFSFVCTLYMQEVLGYTAFQTALALVPASVLCAFVQLIAARVIARVGLAAAGAVGLFATSLGFLWLLPIGPDSAYAATVLPASILVFGVGQGIAYPTFVAGGLTGARPEEQGLAAGIQSTSLQVGGGLGLSLVGAAVALGLGAAEAGDAETYLGALRAGILVGAAIPFLGAVVALFGLRDQKG